MADGLIAGRYRLDSLLGRGGMSEVWRATDAELGRRVPLKLLAPDEDIARFEHEARTFAALGRPNVTQLCDYGEADERPFMVLEYVPGGTLEDRLRDGALPDEQTWTIAADAYEVTRTPADAPTATVPPTTASTRPATTGATRRPTTSPRRRRR